MRLKIYICSLELKKIEIKYTKGDIISQLLCAWKVIGFPEILNNSGLNQDPKGIKGAHDKSPFTPNWLL